MEQRSHVSWWQKTDRRMWTDDEIIRIVPPWIQAHSNLAAHGKWLRALQLPVTSLYAGHATDLASRVKLPYAVNGCKQMLGDGTLTRVWDRYYALFPPDGQLKNFFVAIATMSSVPVGKITVLLAGSKSARPSGMWHDMFCYYLLARGYSGHVTAIDPNQDACEFRYTLQGSSLRFTGKTAFLSENEVGEGYDVVVDDIYDNGPSGKKWKSKFFSTKDHLKGCKPFFHFEEGRQFSVPFHIVEAPFGCKCYRCSFEAMIPLDQSLVLAMTSQIESHPCKGHVDMSFVSQVLKKLERQPYVEPVGPSEVRSVLALSSTKKIELYDNVKVVMREGPRAENAHRDVTHVRSVGFIAKTIVQFTGIGASYFEDKSVGFFGVSPTMLGPTRIREASKTGMAGFFDVGFFVKPGNMYDMMRCREVFYDQSNLVGHENTGRFFGQYSSFIRKHTTYIKEPVIIVSSAVPIDLVCEGKSLYMGSDPRGCLQKIGLHALLERLKKDKCSERYHIDDELHRQHLTYCDVHKYCYPVKWHRCKDSMCSDCGVPIGQCVHTREFVCGKCKELRPGAECDPEGNICARCFGT